MPYATEKETALAIRLGYTETRSQRFGSRFEKGTRRVWCFLAQTNRIRWQTADIIDNSYTGHTSYSTLSEALARPVLGVQSVAPQGGKA